MTRIVDTNTIGTGRRRTLRHCRICGTVLTPREIQEVIESCGEDRCGQHQETPPANFDQLLGRDGYGMGC